jgi:ribosome biogenesis GTPase
MNDSSSIQRISGVVVRIDRDAARVFAGGTVHCCRPAVHSPADSTPVRLAVGDGVEVEPASAGPGRIVTVLPRRNKVSRSAVGAARAKSAEQILAVNIDQVAAVLPADRLPPEWFFLDGLLALAETAGVPAVILLSKIDALPDSPAGRRELFAEAENYRSIGYAAVSCSARAGAGLAEVRGLFRGKASLLLGKSGAGKSTLLNALHPEWAIATRGVNRFGEGRCTTANAQWHPFAGGAAVDTPGIRRLALWDPDGADPAYWYREMRPFLGRCRFGPDCRHSDEPGCALRRAVEAGRVSPRRFRSMLRMGGGAE